MSCFLCRLTTYIIVTFDPFSTLIPFSSFVQRIKISPFLKLFFLFPFLSFNFWSLNFNQALYQRTSNTKKKITEKKKRNRIKWYVKKILFLFSNNFRKPLHFPSLFFQLRILKRRKSIRKFIQYVSVTSFCPLLLDF